MRPFGRVVRHAGMFSEGRELVVPPRRPLLPGVGRSSLVRRDAAVGEPSGWGEVLTAWRPPGAVAALLVLAAVAYLLGVLRLRRRGERWPWHRTAAGIAFVVVVVTATDGPVG